MSFTLQLIHLADQEAGVPALEDAPRASAVLNALKDDYENTLVLSSGDAYIPGLFFSASEEAFGGAGRADMLIQNELGIQAIALGNHEADLGTAVIRDMIAGEVIAEDISLQESQTLRKDNSVDTPSTGTFTTSLKGNRLTVSGEFSNLTSPLQEIGGIDDHGNPESAIHINMGQAGSVGPVVSNLTVEVDEENPTSGPISGNFEGTVDLSDEQVETLLSRGFYINLKTQNHTGGELRAQINLEKDSPANFSGANFPYLSSNIDFSTDDNLADLVVPDDQPPVPNSIAATSVIDVNGQKIGVVGATTPTLPNISSPGELTVLPKEFAGDPTPQQIDALAKIIQTDVDELLAANPGMNKVILLSHMQQISIEEDLATRLENVDIIIAGGSNTRLFDENDRARDGDTEQGVYPIMKTDAAGKPVAVVNTDGNYKYVGRLVIDFDDNGHLLVDSYNPDVSGAYATDEAGVAALEAEDLIDPDIQEIVDQLNNVIVAKESNLFGLSKVYLNGRRSSVRIEETNLGNLVTDANLATAKQSDPKTVIAIQNGGSIRDDIGQVIVPAGSTGEPIEKATEEVPNVKPAGGISETDIANTLRFNNGLTLVTVTAEELVNVVEHGVAATTLDDANTQGRFPQVSGMAFSFDPTAAAGDRIQSLVVTGENGKDAEVVVEKGEIVGDAERTFRVVTANFLAGGGDGYPFPQRDIMPLVQPEEAPRTGAATFAPDGSEQDAFAEYLAENTSEQTPFEVADTAREEDTRIQNLAFREDTVIDGSPLSTSGLGSAWLLIIGAGLLLPLLFCGKMLLQRKAA
ncbi:MAG: 5'-nucleotidase C-terminal domain-containing protein [Cyanobacteria bacterium P01_D01_bin.105]